MAALEQRPTIDPRDLPHECVLILTPLGKDGQYTKQVLASAAINAHTCADLGGLCDLITEEVSVLLIAEEALTNHESPKLIEKLNNQPAWSDLPIVIFVSGGEATDAAVRVLRLFEKSGNVSLLERPVHSLTLVSTVQVARRARRRQWEIRELLAQREQLLTEARAAREEAEAANRMKDQFLATLSHELRTPLNAILGWTQLMSSEELPLEDVKIGVQTIDRNARTQAQLIEDLLDVSRIVSGKLRLDFQEVDVLEVLNAAMSSVARAASTRGVKISFRPSGPIPHIIADPARLQQIVWNLLSNAVKFTAKGGNVTLEAECIHGSLLLSVHDNGVGIEQAFLPYVFDRFRQADGSSTRRQGGLGLGLSIVKQLVELHGGEVSVSSEGVGKGSEFTVQLPLHQADGSAAAVQNSHTAGIRTGEGKPQPRANIAGLKILVVDDEADARNVIQRILSDRDAIVRVAESVTSALDSIDQAKPDIIISDISMPERDGFDLIHELRTDGHAAQHIPVIALTAYARAEDRDRILKAGFDAHLAKPIDTKALLETLHTTAGKT